MLSTIIQGMKEHMLVLLTRLIKMLYFDCYVFGQIFKA